MIPKKKILFIAEDVTLAHSSRAYVLAGHVDKNQFEIHFATSPRSKFLITDPDINYHEIQTLEPSLFIKRLKKGQPVYTIGELERSVKEDISLVERLKPDLVIGDFRLSLGISAELTGTEYAAITNAHWSPYSTQPFPVPDHWCSRLVGLKIAKSLFHLFEPVIFWYHARSFNKLRRLYNLQPVGSLKDIYTYSNWTLFSDIPSIAPTRTLAKNQKYIGPVIWSPDIPWPEWWESLPQKAHFIYITMGSSGDIALLNNILQAVRGTFSTTLVATAGRVAVEPTLDVYVAEYLPGIDAIKKSALVICSGGSATAYQALSLGVPVLGVPSNADQFFTMESIEKNGAGILLRPTDASVERLQKAVNLLLNVNAFKVRAMSLATETSQYDSSKLFPAFLDEWCEQSK